MHESEKCTQVGRPVWLNFECSRAAALGARPDAGYASAGTGELTQQQYVLRTQLTVGHGLY